MQAFLLILSAMLGTLTQANGNSININRCIEWSEVLSAFNQSALDEEFFAWQDAREQERLDAIMDQPVDETIDEVEFDWHGNYWDLMQDPNMTSELACELVQLQYAAYKQALNERLMLEEGLAQQAQWQLDWDEYSEEAAINQMKEMETDCTNYQLELEEAQMEHALGEVLVQEKLDLLKFMIEWQECHLVS